MCKQGIILFQLLLLLSMSVQAQEEYKFVAKLGAPSAGLFNFPRNVLIDKNDNLYVADTENHRIQKFNSSGQFIIQWGSQGSADGQFSYPYGLAVDSSGNVYVADSYNHRIQKFTSSGQFLLKWGTFGSTEGQFNYPYGLALDTDSNVYVVDTANNRIQKFTNNGQFIAQWGAQGSNDGQFSNPYGLALDSNNNLYIVDNGNNRVQKFTSNGQFITKWGSQGSDNGQFSYPYGVALDKSGNVYVADTSNYRIQKFTSDGLFITQWGRSQTTSDNLFDLPRGVAVDSSGNVYVADTNNHQIQKFAPVIAIPTVVNLDCTQPATYDTAKRLINLSLIDTNSFDAITGIPKANEVVVFSGQLQQSSKNLELLDNTHFKIVDNSLAFLNLANAYAPSHARYTYDNAFSMTGGKLELCVQVPIFTVVPPGVKIVGTPKNYMMKLQQLTLQSSAFNVLSITPVNP